MSDKLVDIVAFYIQDNQISCYVKRRTLGKRIFQEKVQQTCLQPNRYYIFIFPLEKY